MSIASAGARLTASAARTATRPLASNNYKGFFFGMVGVGMAYGLGRGAYRTIAPYAKEYIRDWGLQQNKMGQGYVNTNRDPWVGTKGAQAPMGATGDLALAAGRIRNRSY